MRIRTVVTTAQVIVLFPLSLLSQSSFPPPAGGGGVGSGTVTSVATGCGMSGGTITTTGTVLASETVRAQTTTSDTFLDGDCGKLVTHTNGSAIAVTLPQANGSTFKSGWFVKVQNRGVGTITITPTISTVDGAATLTLLTSDGVEIHSDGTDYFTVRGRLRTILASELPACPTCGVTGSPLSQFAATTSAQLAGVISDETGSGLAVFNNGPTFIAPLLGTPASVTLTNATGLPASAISSGTIATARLGSGSATAGTFLQGDQSWAAISTAFSVLTAGTNTASLVMGSGGTLDVSGTGTINATSLGGSAAALYAKLASPTFTGTVTLPSGQALIAPALGTPASGVMTNMTGLALAGTPLTTKGDLLGVSTVLGRLAVGSDSQVLTADAASTLGFKWAAAVGGGANTGLSNLASVSINTSLLAQTGVDLGATATPFRDLYLFGAGTYATTYLKLTGTPTSTRTVTFPDATDTVAELGQNNVFSANGALSSGAGPGAKFNGTWITGGSATTTKPYVLIEPTGATSAAWSTNGTGLGINAASGFSGRLLELQVAGASVFFVNQAGSVTIASGGGFASNTVNNTTANTTLTINNNAYSTAARFAITMGSGTHSQTSGTNGALTIIPTYNQTSGTAANTDLLINRTQTAVGSGAQLLIDAQVSTASKFSVSNTGVAIIADLKNTGAATGKTVVCVDTTTGQLYASTSGVACAN